jgi:nucleoside-diphosphate-sugar epimerase
MKTLVIGAAGWLGRAILSALNGHEISAFDRSPEAWENGNRIDGPLDGGTVIHGDVSDYDAIDEALNGVDAVIHAAVYASPDGYHERDELPFTINLKGLWNVLESARRRNTRRVVHIGSCHVINPKGIFFAEDVRRPDGSLYAVTKRLQEEMCRQYHDAFELSQVILRPCTIIDSRLALGKGGRKLEPGTWDVSWVCRHDIGKACRAAIEKEGIDFEILHVAGSPEADQYCNVARTREVLGMTFSDSLAAV